MANTVDVKFSLDEDLLKGMELVCEDIGISMEKAFTMFMKKVNEIKDIPSEIYKDPFYSESNQRYLDKVISEIKAGTAKLEEHDLIEV